MYLESKPLQIAHIGYAQNGKDDALTPASGKALHLYNVKAENRSGGAINVGLLVKFRPASWTFYKIVALDTPDGTDNTATIQAGTSVTVFANAVVNNGYLVGATRKYNLIGLTVGTAPSSNQVFSYQYYNGTAYTTLTTIAVPTYATGTNLVVFNAPHDWATGTTAAVGGNSDQYNILVRATTAPDTVAGVISALWVGQFLDFQEGVADNAALELNMTIDRPIVLSGNEGVFPYFSGTASADNAMRIIYAVQD